MINVRAISLRVFGAIAALLGVAGLLLISMAVVEGGAELLSTPGATVLLFLFSLALLCLLAGASLVSKPIDQLRGSLVPRWALVASGLAMLISVALLVYFRGIRAGAGIVFLVALGVFWLVRGLKGPRHVG